MYVAVNGLLKTVGRYLVDGNGAGNRWKMAGVNWAGAHQDNLVPGGLDYINVNTLAAQLASWGINSVRFPFASNTVLSTTPINPAYVTGPNNANPSMIGMTPWQVYQACVTALTGAGITVIPNHHLLFQGWCCGVNDTNGLWWNANWSFPTFQSVWQTVATAFAANPLVIGYDIKNEPRPATILGKNYRPTWGDGNTKTDLQYLYNTMANVIQTIDTNALIFCEFPQFDSLTQATVTEHLVVPKTANTVVYSNHFYPMGAPTNLTQSQFNTNVTNGGGFFLNANQEYTSPFWIGEFGMTNTSTALLGVGTPATQSTAGEAPGAGGGSISYRNWWAYMQNWLRTNDADWCWWHLSGTHVKGTVPSTNELRYQLGDHCWDGLYSASWNGASNPTLLSQLQSLQTATLGPGTPYH